MGWRRALVDSAKGAVYFVALGPPVGALALVGVACVQMVWQSPVEALSKLPGMLGFALLAMLFSWGLAALPALVTGLLLGPWRRRFHQWRWCLVAGVVGACVASLGLMGGSLLPGGGRPSLLLQVLPGFVAGVLVARLFAVRAPYPPAKLPPLPLPLPQSQSQLQSAPSGPPPAPQLPGSGESP